MLARGDIPFRCWATPACRPVVGGRATGFGISPYVPVPPVVGARRAGLDEPWMLIRSMVGYVIHDNFQATLMGLRHECVERCQVTEERVYIRIVSDIVAEVDHRRGVN